MKLVIAGSRDYHNIDFVAEMVDKHYGFDSISEIVCGGASGVDTCASKIAQAKNIACKEFYPDWSVGLKGGPLRNAQMAEYGDALIAFPYSNSKGTKNMIHQMESRRKPVVIVYLDEGGENEQS